MAYLINQARLHALTIGGVNYTESMISWTCSDSSANKNGLISTSGTLILGQKPGGYDTEDYDRDNFKRGTPVILTITYPSGTVATHPRGLLYVLASSYNPESRELTIDMGCRLVLANMTDQLSAISGLEPIPLDPTQQTYSNYSASFASAGKYLYQDNTGSLVSGTFFQGDTTASVTAGDWTSVLGVTTLAVSPLGGTSPVPDQITLSYRVPAGLLASDQSGKITTDITESYYYVTYPATVYQRSNNGTLTDINGVTQGQDPTATASACGNTPAQPGDNGTASCNLGYELTQTPHIIPVVKLVTNIAEYNGPAGQLSRTYSVTEGPALEANGQYFSDKFAYCRYTWATACQPNGACPFEGQDNITLTYTETLYYYGTANELVKTVRDTYATVLSAAQPFNWRSGVVNGVPQDFTELSLTDMYRVSSVIEEYSSSDNQNQQLVTTYTSITSRQSGITGDIDALSGVKTLTRRISTTILTSPLQPDIVNSSTTSTDDKTTTLRLYTGRYGPLAESGPLIQEEQIPVPLLFTTQAEIDSTVSEYINYLERFVKGDAFGLQISESLREDIATGWHPGMPFRYYDSSKGKLMAMRMDGTQWGVDREGSALTTNGIWIGYSDGSVTVDNNLIGDSRPDMGSGTTPPVGPGNAPVVAGETFVDSGAYAFDVDVHFMIKIESDVFGPFYQADATYTYDIFSTTTAFVSGFTVTSGDVLTLGPNGYIPLDYNGQVITTGATVVTADLFA